MLKIVLLTVAVTIAVSPTAIPQEKESAEEILQYFPQETYVAISYVNREAAARAESYQLYEQYAGKIGPGSDFVYNPLKNVLSGEEVWLAKAVFSNHKEVEMILQQSSDDNIYAERAEKLREKYPNMKGLSVRRNQDDGSTIATALIESGDTLLVLRYDDLSGAMKQALEQGKIEKTDTVLFGKPVFSTKGRSMTKESRQFFACVSDAGELLVAGRLENLKRMLATAAGQELDVLANPAHVDLIDLIPDLGQMWSVNYNQRDPEELRERMEKQGQRDEDIEEILERYRREPQYRIITVSLADVATIKTILAYRNEDDAEAGLAIQPKNRQFQSYNEDAPELIAAHKRMYNLMLENTSLKRSDTWVVETTVLDKKLFDAAVDMENALNDWRKQQEQKQMKQKEEKDKG